jgi:hypothetical protein
MDAQRRLFSIATWGFVFAAASPMRFLPPGSRAEPAACSLLTVADVATALGAPSQPGKDAGMGPTGCIWSNDPAASDTSRRVALNTHSVRAFGFAKMTKATIKIEPVTGVGDEAFYQIYPNDQSPFIWVRKGDVTFSIRILSGLKPKPFTLEQEKSKELVLAKAALSQL